MRQQRSSLGLGIGTVGREDWMSLECLGCRLRGNGLYLDLHGAAALELTCAIEKLFLPCLWG